MIMLLLYVIISIFIAWIWVDYFRLIDLYDKEDLKHFLIVFVFGAASIFLVYAVQYFIFIPLKYQLNGGIIHDFLFCVFGIGLVEESAKIMAFLLFYIFFKKAINEPLDLLVFIATAALGFSAFENVSYFSDQGAQIISGRSILASITHMFCTSLFAYGIIRYRYFYQSKKPYIILWYLLLAAISHGFYDFWLLVETGIYGSWIITIFYFMVTVSLFAVILNNAINHSEYFSYHKVTNPAKIINRLLLYYFLIFVMQFLMIALDNGFVYAFSYAISSVYLTGFIIVVSVLRLSRFKLIQNRWHPLKFELPFGLIKHDALPGESSYGFHIKGDSYNEAHLNNYFQDYMMLSPVNLKNSFLETQRLAFIEEKIFLENDEAFYLIRVFINQEDGPFMRLLIKPKKNGLTFMKNKYPIVAVLDINDRDLSDRNLTMEHFVFKEWAFVRPRIYHK